MTTTPPAPPVKLFCGYHPEDHKLYKELHLHLKPFVRQNLLTIRDPDCILPGSVRRLELEKELSAAQVIVFLVSTHLRADNDWNALLTRAADAADKRRARLVPILVGGADLADTPLAGREHLPRAPARPLNILSRTRSNALTAIAKEIHMIVRDIEPRAPVRPALGDLKSRKDRAYGLKYQGKGKEALDELRLALKELDALMKDEPENDASRKERAHIYDRIAQCEYAQGRLAAARAAFDRAFGIRTDLCLSHRDDVDALFDLSTSRFWRGYLSYLQGDLKGAHDEQRAGLEVCQTLYGRDATNLPAARSLVVLQTDLGTTCWELGDPAAADSHLRDALALVRDLAKQSPDNLQLHRDLSVGLFRLADFLLARGETEEATRLCEESIRACWALTDLAPTNVQWRRHLATARISMGSIRLSRDDLTLARGDYEFASGALGALAALEPENLQGARHHARAEKSLGYLLARTGDRGGAMAAYARAASAMEAACAGEVSERWQRELDEIHAALSCERAGSA